MPSNFNEFNYLEKISYLSYYFQYLHKRSGGDGNSELIKLLNPVPEKLAHWKDLRGYILVELIRKNNCNLLSTALEAESWLRAKFQIPIINIKDREEKLKNICNRYDDSIKNTAGEHKDVRVEKCLQLIRLYWLMSEGVITHQSRAVEFFFSEIDIYLGKTDAAPIKGYHHEHVVPCAFIRDLFLGYFKSQKLVVGDMENTTYANDLAEIANRILGVVHISKEQKNILDANKEKSMKTKMPNNWDPLTGDIFARLTTHGWNVTTPESLGRW